ncbi:MAG TPA: hypothetical protein VEM13_08275 [Gemmatimonadales bacterium]|nr:hypothetical protein [Gemmatimonadales bacterium]
MTRYFMPRWLRRALSLVGLAATLPLGCKDFLSVTEPDIVLDPKLAAGATALHNGAVLRLAQAVTGTQGPDALFLFGGLLTDEWRSGDTFVQRNNQDQRIWDPTNTFNAGPFRSLNRVRTQARAAIDALRTYAPKPLSNVGRMFAFVAYVEVLLGEHYCNGIPLDSLSGTTVIYGNPISDDSMFELAIANADSALANVGGADSAKVANFSKVIKGRALVDRANFAGAAVVVAAVPDTFHYDVTHSLLNSNVNQINALNNGAKRYTVADTEGVNGLNYVSARDPRLPTQLGKTTDLIFDSQYGFRILRQGIWGQTSSVKIASGIEARLIEAEAALQAGDATTWLNKLNAPRAIAALLPVPLDTNYRPVAGTTLAPLADPGAAPDTAARTNLMFRERAFWMFSTGHRLGDMRRLVRQYGHPVNTIYPIGGWFKGGNYGDAIQMAIPIEEQNNPNFHGCADRNP